MHHSCAAKPQVRSTQQEIRHWSHCQVCLWLGESPLSLLCLQTLGGIFKAVKTACRSFLIGKPELSNGYFVSLCLQVGQNPSWSKSQLATSLILFAVEIQLDKTSEIDYALLAAPLFTSTYIETNHKVKT